MDAVQPAATAITPTPPKHAPRRLRFRLYFAPPLLTAMSFLPLSPSQRTRCVMSPSPQNIVHCFTPRHAICATGAEPQRLMMQHAARVHA
jgi:hypothetical protein